MRTREEYRATTGATFTGRFRFRFERRRRGFIWRREDGHNIAYVVITGREEIRMYEP